MQSFVDFSKGISQVVEDLRTMVNQFEVSRVEQGEDIKV